MVFLLDAARFIHYTAALQLFGMAAFQFLLAAPMLRESLDRPARRTASLSAILLLAGGLLWLVATSATMGDGWQDGLDPAVLWTVLSATSFGHVWGPHLLLCTALLVLSNLRGFYSWGVLSGLSSLSLVSLGLVGHAATESGWLGLLSRTSQTLHLLSSGFWLGSLVPLLFCLAQFRTHEAASRAALRRFSGLGHFAVAILLLSGVSNSWLVLRNAGLDPASLYQQLLFAKIAEIALGAGMMGLVSVLGTLSPS